MADNTIDNLSIQVTASAEEASRVFDRLASNAGKLKGATSGAAQGMQQAADAAQDMGTATQEAGEQAGQAQKPVRDLGKDAKRAGKDAKEGSSGLKTFWESLKRIAFYRAVRSVIKGITEAFKTGITNLYQWSKLMDGTFAKSMDRLATSSLYLKNSLGAMLAPIINALTPIIETIVDGLVWIINHINMVFAMLSGSQTYTVAKKVATTWGDAGKSAASSAKKASDDIKRTILGFDEINKLEKQNDSSVGSGSGNKKNGIDYASMFETKQLPSWMATIASVIDKFKLGWAGVLAGLLAGWAAVKKAIKAVSDLSFGWLKKMAGKTISIAVSLVRQGWTTIKDWALKFGAAVVDLAVRIKTNVKQLWAQFAAQWAALSPVLKVGIAVTTTAALLWALYKAAWAIAPDKVLQVKTAIVTTAQELWTSLQTGWAAVKEKILKVGIGISITAVALFEMFKGAWLNIQNRVLDVGIVPSNTAQELWSEVQRGWESITDKILKVVVKPEVEPATNKFAAHNAASQGVGSWQGADPGYLPGDENPFTVSQLFGKLNGLNTKGLGKSVATVAVGIVGAVLAGGLPALAASANNAMVLTPQNKLKQQLRPLNMPGAGRDQSNVVPKNTLPFDTNWLANATAKNKIISFTQTVVDSAVNMRNALADGTGKAAEAVRQFVDKYGQLRDNALGITWVRVGTNATTTLKNGIDQTWYQATASVSKGMDDLYNTANNKSFTFDGIGYNIAVDIYNGFIENINWVSNSIGNTITNMSNWVSNSIRGISNMLNGSTRASTTTVKRSTASKPTKSTRYNALGGIFANGIWSSIPQYANGTLNAGSLFWAGERGPELVGRAGGRTEVLNKSQLASAMYSAVQAAMAPAAANFAAAANYLQSGNNAFDMEMLAEMVRQGVESAMERQGDIQRQQLDALRQINEKEFVAEVTTSSINNAQRRTNRRMGMTVVPVSQ